MCVYVLSEVNAFPDCILDKCLGQVLQLVPYPSDYFFLYLVLLSIIMFFIHIFFFKYLKYFIQSL